MESVININFLESTSSLSKINTSSKWYLFKKFIFKIELLRKNKKQKLKNWIPLKKSRKLNRYP